MSKFNANMLLTGFGDGSQWKQFIHDLIDDAVMMSTSPHRRPDTVAEDTADATTEATAYALANSLKAKYNTHIALTSAHFVADATNGVTAADADSVASLLTLGNEIKADFNKHLADKGHVASDLVNEIKADDIAGDDEPAKLAAAYVLLNEAKAKFNAHRVYAWGPLRTSR